MYKNLLWNLKNKNDKKVIVFQKYCNCTVLHKVNIFKIINMGTQTDHPVSILTYYIKL